MALLPVDEPSQRGNVSLGQVLIVNRCDGCDRSRSTRQTNQRWLPLVTVHPSDSRTCADFVTDRLFERCEMERADRLAPVPLGGEAPYTEEEELACRRAPPVKRPGAEAARSSVPRRRAPG